MEGRKKERRGNGDGGRKEKRRNKREREGTKAYLNACKLNKNRLTKGAKFELASFTLV